MLPRTRLARPTFGRGCPFRSRALRRSAHNAGVQAVINGRAPVDLAELGRDYAVTLKRVSR